jgi:GrpB-like predicted nucleotidyltransferase (UPF0157 family)
VSEPVVIVEADPAWPARYEAERARLAAALAAHRHVLEHCGSTSVPGLAAKPIVDVLLGVYEWPMAPAAVAAVVGAGYEHRGDGNVPGREYFRRGVPRAFQVHACPHDGVFWRAHLAFRDRLRADRGLAREYEALKRDLAVRFRHDRIGYTDAKAPFIRRVLGLGAGPLVG